jgi:hypothetical protein
LVFIPVIYLLLDFFEVAIILGVMSKRSHDQPSKKFRPRCAMMRLIFRPISLLLIAMGAVLALAACSDEKAAAPAGAPPADRAQQQAQLNQRLAGLQDRAAALNKLVADMQVDQQQRLQNMNTEVKLLNEQIAQLNRDLGVAGAPPVRPAAPPLAAPSVPAPTAPRAVAPAGAEPAAEAVQPESSPSRFLIRLILILIMIAAIAYIIKIFLGRWGEEDEEEEFGPESGDEEYSTEEGTIRIVSHTGPSAEEPAHDAESRVTGDDDEKSKL